MDGTVETWHLVLAAGARSDADNAANQCMARAGGHTLSAWSRSWTRGAVPYPWPTTSVDPIFCRARASWSFTRQSSYTGNAARIELGVATRPPWPPQAALCSSGAQLLMRRRRLRQQGVLGVSGSVLSGRRCSRACLHHLTWVRRRSPAVLMEGWSVSLNGDPRRGHGVRARRPASCRNRADLVAPRWGILDHRDR